jgi:hypothetical protein
MDGLLWSSSLYDGYDAEARSLGFSCDGGVYEHANNLYYGQSVRGVQA